MKRIGLVVVAYFLGIVSLGIVNATHTPTLNAPPSTPSWANHTVQKNHAAGTEITISHTGVEDWNYTVPSGKIANVTYIIELRVRDE